MTITVVYLLYLSGTVVPIQLTVCEKEDSVRACLCVRACVRARVVIKCKIYIELFRLPAASTGPPGCNQHTQCVFKHDTGFAIY